MRLAFTALAALAATPGQAAGFTCEIDQRNAFSARNSGKELGCWLQWSGWSECLGTCGKGVKTASRKCRSETGFAIPSNTVGCEGSEIKRRSCSDSTITSRSDSCAYWSYWSEWSVCETEAHFCSRDRNFGRRRRNRVCNDPEATLLGMSARCEGTTEEFEGCVTGLFPCPEDDQPNCIQDSNYLPLPYENQSWGPCSTRCGPGQQESLRTHVCADYPDTWLLPQHFQKRQYRSCYPANPKCTCSLWTDWTPEPDPCLEITQTRRSYGAPGEDCQSETQIRDVGIPPPSRCTLPENDDGWRCDPQPAPWNNQIQTTCGGNGLAYRQCIHFCALRHCRGPYNIGGDNNNCQFLTGKWAELSFTQGPIPCCAGQAPGTPCPEIPRKVEISCGNGCDLKDRCEEVMDTNMCPDINPWNLYGNGYGSNGFGLRKEINCPSVLPDGSTVQDRCPKSQPSCCLPGQMCGPGVPRCLPTKVLGFACYFFLRPEKTS